MMEWMKRLGMDSSFVDRYLNEGFSGGEKKRNEIMQMAILEPEARDPRRDRLGPRHRRAAHRRARASTRSAPAPDLGRRADHPLPAAARRGHARPRPHAGRRPHRRQSAAWSSPTSSRRRATRRAHERPGEPSRRGGGTDGGHRTAASTLDVDGSRPSSRSWSARSTASRSSTSTRANTSQKPRQVHRRDGPTSTSSHNANVHRSVYRLAEEATDAYEGGRGRASRGSSTRRSPTRSCSRKNATEAINLVAHAWGAGQPPRGRRGRAHPDGAPRQHRALAARCAGRAGHRARAGSRSTADGRLDLGGPRRACSTAPRSLAVTAMSNVLGTINAGRRADRAPRTPPARSSMVDACQSVPHNAIDVAALGADFVAFTGHKMRGPTGIGGAVGPARAARRDAAVPRRRQDDRRRHASTASRPNAVAGEVRGRHAADRRGDRARRGDRVPRGARHGRTSAHHEMELTRYASRRLGDRVGTTIYGPKRRRAPRWRRCQLLVRDLHPHDMARCSTNEEVCDPRRPPLRQAADAAARRGGDDAGLLLPLQHRRTTSTRWPMRSTARGQLLRTF